MAVNDPLIVPGGTTQLPPITTVYPETGLPQQTQSSSGKFLRVLGGIAGGAMNFVMPGLGGILGNVISRGGSSYGSYVGLMEQQRQMDEMNRYNQMANSLQQKQQQIMLNQQQQQSFQLISVQHRASMQSQEFSTVSNLMKSRHDSEMTAVNNIKS